MNLNALAPAIIASTGLVTAWTPAMASEISPVEKNQISIGDSTQSSRVLKDGYWYAKDTILTVAIAGSVEQLEEPDLMILIDDTDITSLVLINQGIASVKTRPLNLKTGLHKLHLYVGSPLIGWKLYKSIEFGILDRFGFEKSSFLPTGSLELTAQPAFIKRGGTALPPPDPSTYIDLDYTLGLKTELQRYGWKVLSNQDWVGTDQRMKALRFDVLGDKAPLLDLSGYNFSVIGPSTQIELGDNQGIGTNKLLIDRIANRGITLKQSIGTWSTAALTAQSGRLITGYDNILGLSESFNNAYGIEYTLHPFKRENDLKISFSWLDAEQPATSDFGFGQVPVGEAANGWGLRADSKLYDDRLNVSAEYASSTYSAPNQQEIDEFGQESIFLKTTTNQAYQGDLGFQLVAIDSPYAMNLGVSGGRYDPQYRVLSGFSGADKLFGNITLSGSINNIDYSFFAGSSRDNLDDIDSVLTTQTDNFNINLTVPFQTIAIGDTENKKGYEWIPSLSFNYTYLGQYGINNPATNPLSLFTEESQIPKQYNNIYNLGLSWNFGSLNADVKYAYAYQNNQQLGRESADSYINSIEISARWQPLDSLSISPRIMIVEELFQLTTDKQSDLQHGIDIAYSFNENLSLSGGYSYGNNYVSTGVASSTNWTSFAQVTYAFLSPLGLNYKTPGSVYFRVSYSGLSQYDEAALIRQNGSNLWFNVGFSLKIF